MSGAGDVPSHAIEKEKEKRSICGYFNTPSGCRNGDSCRFLHTKTTDSSIPIDSAIAVKTIQVQTNKEFEQILDYYFTNFSKFMEELHDMIQRNRDQTQKLNYICELICSHSMHEVLSDYSIKTLIQKMFSKISDYNYLNNAIYAKWLISKNVKESFQTRRNYDDVVQTIKKLFNLKFTTSMKNKRGENAIDCLVKLKKRNEEITQEYFDKVYETLTEINGQNLIREIVAMFNSLSITNESIPSVINKFLWCMFNNHEILAQEFVKYCRSRKRVNTYQQIIDVEIRKFYEISSKYIFDGPLTFEGNNFEKFFQTHRWNSDIMFYNFNQALGQYILDVPLDEQITIDQTKIIGALVGEINNEHLLKNFIKRIFEYENDEYITGIIMAIAHFKDNFLDSDINDILIHKMKTSPITFIRVQISVLFEKTKKQVKPTQKKTVYDTRFSVFDDEDDDKENKHDDSIDETIDDSSKIKGKKEFCVPKIELPEDETLPNPNKKVSVRNLNTIGKLDFTIKNGESDSPVIDDILYEISNLSRSKKNVNTCTAILISAIDDLTSDIGFMAFQRFIQESKLWSREQLHESFNLINKLDICESPKGISKVSEILRII